MQSITRTFSTKEDLDEIQNIQLKCLISSFLIQEFLPNYVNIKIKVNDTLWVYSCHHLGGDFHQQFYQSQHELNI